MLVNNLKVIITEKHFILTSKDSWILYCHVESAFQQLAISYELLYNNSTARNVLRNVLRNVWNKMIKPTMNIKKIDFSAHKIEKILKL